MKKEIRIECLSEIFEEIGIIATKEQIQIVVEEFSAHIEMESEMDHYAHAGYKEECQKCKQLEGRVKLLERENQVFINSVKQRRGASSVWIDRDSVMYER